MSVSLLSQMRGSDGRSIARALIGVLLLAALLAGLNGGAGASATHGFAVCATGSRDPGDASAIPAGHVPDCCITGHVPTAMAPTAAPETIVEASRLPAVPDFSPWQPPARHVLAGSGPRGPPLAA